VLFSVRRDEATLQPIGTIDAPRPLFLITGGRGSGTRLETDADLALSRARLGAAAQLLGLGARCIEMAADYAKERHQFGKPIGSFQAVKHKCADMLVDVEMSRSAMYFAAWAASEDDPELALASSIAKAYCGDAYTRVASNGIHVHGGIGFTWEHDMHLYFKRAKTNEVFLGDPTYHRDLVARLVAA
jgi:alkylation response protein AidB-like acyl-CoA dehydrogenase